MASASKTTAITLLAIGLVLGGLGAFLPTGENWIQNGDVRGTEVFTLFTYTFRLTSGDAVVREDGPMGWDHDRLDGAGSTAMYSSGIVVIAALLVLVVGTILSVPWRTARGGGLLAILGAAGLAAATALAVVGMRARTEAVLGTANGMDPRAGLFLLGAAFLSALVGAAIVVSQRRRTDAGSDASGYSYEADAARIRAAGPARTLRCPDCGATTRAPLGTVPTCASCGFHRREPGPAAMNGFGDTTWSAA